MPCRSKEIFFCLIELHYPVNGAIFFFHSGQHPAKESSICNFIDHSWSTGKYSIFNSQMRPSIENSITGAVPTPYRAVVQRECRELGNSSIFQNCARVFL